MSESSYIGAEILTPKFLFSAMEVATDDYDERFMFYVLDSDGTGKFDMFEQDIDTPTVMKVISQQDAPIQSVLEHSVVQFVFNFGQDGLSWCGLVSLVPGGEELELSTCEGDSMISGCEDSKE